MKAKFIFAPVEAMRDLPKEIPGTRFYIRPGWKGSPDCDRNTLYIVIFVGAKEPVNRFALEAMVMLLYYDYGCKSAKVLIGLKALMNYTSLWQELTGENQNVDFTGGLEMIEYFLPYTGPLVERTCSYPDGYSQALRDYTESRRKENPELRDVTDYKIWDDYSYKGKHLHYFLITHVGICKGDKSTALELCPHGSMVHATFKHMDLLTFGR